MMSVYSTSLGGLQTQSRAMAGYAQNIATSGIRVIASLDDSSAPIPEDSVSPGIPLEDAMVGMSVAKHAYTANAKVIAIQSEMDQQLLDILS